MERGERFREELAGSLKPLLRYARTLAGADAEDLVQSTVRQALEKQESYDPSRPLVNWLFTLQRHIHLNGVRKEAGRAARLREMARSAEASEAPVQGARMEVEETLALVGRLPSDQKEALFLVAHDGRSYAEAASLLGVEVGTVKSRVSRARAALADMLEEIDCRAAGPAPHA